MSTNRFNSGYSQVLKKTNKKLKKNISRDGIMEKIERLRERIEDYCNENGYDKKTKSFRKKKALKYDEYQKSANQLWEINCVKGIL